MNSEILKIVGQIGGIGGLALGVLLIVFRDVIGKNIFPQLTKEHAYKLLRMIIALVFLVAMAGLGAWIYSAPSIDTRITNADILPSTDISLEKGGNVTFKVDVSYHLSAPFGSIQIMVQNGRTNVAHDSHDISKGDGEQIFSVNVDKIPDATELDVFVALYDRPGDSSHTKQFTYKIK